jgi:CMP-N,N'-diacetyllegionaminic acid synthase
MSVVRQIMKSRIAFCGPKLNRKIRMLGNKSIIAVIPARAGSKGLPNKNIRLLCGKPLIEWTIEKALKSKCLDKILVSTDSQEIGAIAKRAGAEVPFLRPADLASDDASSYDVIRHALDYLSPEVFDYTLLLEPTSPLREDTDIDRVLEALDSKADCFDSVVTVGEVREHPSIVRKIEDDKVLPFIDSLVSLGRRQDLKPAFFPYGVAYCAKTKVLLRENTFYTSRCLAFQLLRYQNFEIDDIYDFFCVEAIMRNKWNTSSMI